MEEKTPALLSLQGTIQVDHQQYPHPHHNFPMYPQQVQAEYPFGAWNMQGSDLVIPSNNNINEAEMVNYIAICGDEQNEQECTWKRVKWTDEMVKVLITALSYLTDDTSPDFVGGRTRDLLIIAKRGKWKAISKVFGERGIKVSPQQCEDKFNDLNKKYRRLVEILGRGTSCEIVENPNLLELMNICENSKEEVRKILSKKKLFYREMCSYYNGNRLFLPHDEGLRKSLKLVVKGKRPCKLDDQYDEDEDPKTEEDAEGNLGKPVVNGVSSMRKKKQKEEEEGGVVEKDRVSPEGAGGEERVQECYIIDRLLRLKKHKLWIQAQMMELKKEEAKWRRICQRGDTVLEKLRIESAYLESENARLSYELKCREISGDNK